MTITEALRSATDAITVQRVFGQPVDNGSATVIPAASVWGLSRGGSGTDPQGQAGEGGGYGVRARPVGAYVIAGDRVSWRPADDLNRIITMAGLVLTAYLLRRSRGTRWDNAPPSATACREPATTDPSSKPSKEA